MDIIDATIAPNSSGINTTTPELYNNNTSNVTTAAADRGAAAITCDDVNTYAFPIQLTICIIGNVLNLLVMTRERITQRHWTATQVFITSLSISDMVFLASQFVPYIENHHLRPDYESKSRNVFEHLTWYTGGVWLWSTQAFNLASDLTLLAFSLERCMATLRPLSRRFAGGRALMARNAVVAIVTFTGLHAGINVGLYYRAIILIDDYNKTRLEATRSEYMPPWLRHWQGEYELIHLILLPMAVFITLTATTTLMLLSLARRSRRLKRNSTQHAPETIGHKIKPRIFPTICRWRNHNQNNNNKPTNNRLDNDSPSAVVLRQHLPSTCRRLTDELSSRQYTFMLIASVVMYLLACSLNFCLNVGDFLDRYLLTSNVFANPDVLAVLRPCDPLLLNWNYALNFVLYSAVSSKFRENMRDLALHGFRRLPSNGGGGASGHSSPLSQRSSTPAFIIPTSGVVIVPQLHQLDGNNKADPCLSPSRDGPASPTDSVVDEPKTATTQQNVDALDELWAAGTAVARRKQRRLLWATPSQAASITSSELLGSGSVKSSSSGSASSSSSEDMRPDSGQDECAVSQTTQDSFIVAATIEEESAARHYSPTLERVTDNA